MNDLNTLLAFHQLVMNKPEDEKIELAEKLSIDYTSYKKRIKGKEKEAELIVILKSLGVLKHFDAFDEGLSHITHEFTSDFRVELTDGYKMLIEVKHTDKDTYDISSGNLQNRIDYAKRHSLPLRFAVSLKGYWGLFTSETLQEKNGKLTINDFGGAASLSWFDREFETCSYMFPKNICIKSVYAHNHLKSMGIKFEPYGDLVSYELYCDNKRIFRAKGKNSNFRIYTILLEALQDRVANIKQNIATNGNYTIITESTDTSSIHSIREYDFLLSYINHMYDNADDAELKYTPERALNDKNFSFIDCRVGSQRHTIFLWQVFVCPPPNRTYTFQCIRLSNCF